MELEGSFLGVIIYVDDILLASSNSAIVDSFKNHLGKHFKHKDLGRPKYFLELEIAQNSQGISVCQRKYVLDLLKDTCLIGCKPIFTHMDYNTKIQDDSSAHLTDQKVYRRLIGNYFICV